jgi:hypothetical protein
MRIEGHNDYIRDNSGAIILKNNNKVDKYKNQLKLQTEVYKLKKEVDLLKRQIKTILESNK